MLKYVVFCVAIIAGNWNISAFSNEAKSKIFESVLPGILECSKEFGVTKDEIGAAKKELKIDGFDPCFLACVFKKAEFMNADGKFDAARVVENSSKLLSDEDDIKKVSEMAEKCSAVNEKGEGCEIAKPLMECVMEFKEFFTPTS